MCVSSTGMQCLRADERTEATHVSQVSAMPECSLLVRDLQDDSATLLCMPLACMSDKTEWPGRPKDDKS